MTILISAGHSNTDPGACGNGYQEATLALKMRNRVAKYLNDMGVDVITDGDENENDPLGKAIKLCKQADVAVEIHFNAGPPTAHGIEALCKPRHKVLAQNLCKAIADATDLTLRGENGYKPDNSGQHHRLGFCEAGGIILEVCFISSKSDMQAYVANKFQVAKAVADVLADSVS